MTLAATVLAAYAALLAGLWWGQERLIFLPSTLPAEHRFLVADDVHEVWVDVPGARLNALHLRLPQPAGVVFFLHGNAGHLGSWFVDIGVYRALGYDLFMLDYRGYGKSTGQVESEAQLLSDVQAAWASISPRYAGRPVVFLGRSLGTGLATQLAAALPPAERPDLLLLVSPFRSLEAMAREHYPFVPVSLLRYPMRNDAALQALAQGPGGGPRVVLVHGEQDTIIGPEHARALSALSPGSRLELIPGAGHNDLQSFDGYRQAIRSALADVLARPRGPGP